MGYRSDVRIILPEAKFNALDEKLRAMEYFPGYDVKSVRNEDADAVKRYSPEREPTRFVYFGWNYIKWYDGEFVNAVESAIYESENYHFMRLGEDYSDIEENYQLHDVWVDCISINRYFDDDFTEEEK